MAIGIIFSSSCPLVPNQQDQDRPGVQSPRKQIAMPEEDVP